MRNKDSTWIVLAIVVAFFLYAYSHGKSSSDTDPTGSSAESPSNLQKHNSDTTDDLDDMDSEITQLKSENEARKLEIQELKQRVDQLELRSSSVGVDFTNSSTVQ